MISPCPQDGEFERLLADQLSAADEARLEAHIADCPGCQQKLEQLTDIGRPVSLSSQEVARDHRLPEVGVLARLAASSSPILRPIRPDQAERVDFTDSSWRRLGSSTSVLVTGRFLRRQFWTWPLIAATLIGLVGWWVSRSVESAMRQLRINELTTVLNADVAALREWMDNQRATAALVAADESLRPLVSELIALTEEAPDVRSRLIQSPAQAAIRARLAEPLRTGGFTGFVVISPSGIPIAVDEDAPIGAKLSGYRREFFGRVTGGEAAVSKPFLSPLLLSDEYGELRANQPCMYAAAPILDKVGRPIGAVGLRLRPEDRFSRILQVARTGSTGETYAFDREGVLLNRSRFDDDLRRIGLLVDRPNSSSILNVEVRDPGVNMVAGERPTTRRHDQPLTRMASAAIQGVNGFDTEGYRDYRGVPVVGAWQWLDDYDFGVATEVDVDEAFAPVYILRRAFAVLMGLLVATAIGILSAILLLSRQRRQLRDANLAAQKFGQYTLEEKIGTGGMGSVYKARHALLRRPTAVKLLNPDSISGTTLARFEREVQLTSELTHPNTVEIYDYGRTPEGVAYYAMEYLEGVNLQELVACFGPLPEPRAVYILLQVCASLAEAHAAGIIHRDVKPANVFLTVRGGQYDFVKVLDFGLAKLASEIGDSSLTATNVVAGTPLCVSPETVNHTGPIDARTDVYAIGVLGYFLITGSLVFTGNSAIELCQMHVSAKPTTPSDRLGRPVGPALEALILRCLAKSPAKRPGDAAELRKLLEACPLAGWWTAADAARWWQQRDEADVATPAPVLV